MSCAPVDLPDIVAEVREVHDKYEAALSRNDLDVLDAFVLERCENHTFWAQWNIGRPRINFCLSTQPQIQGNKTGHFGTIYNNVRT